MIKTNRIYICECGKEYDKPQSFNAHKSSCKIHYEAIGRLNDFLEKRKNISMKVSKTLKEKYFDSKIYNIKV